MDLPLPLQNQITNGALAVSAEHQLPHRDVRLVLVLSAAIPGCQLEHIKHLGIERQRPGRQRSDLVQRCAVGNDAVHLSAEPLADQRLNVLDCHGVRIRPSAQDLGSLVQHPPVHLGALLLG